MSLVRLVSWNVNGIRSLSGKPEWARLLASPADVVALQETRADEGQVEASVRSPEGWHSWWASSEAKKGYSGVAAFCRTPPARVDRELPDPAYRGEGRLLHLEFPDFHCCNVYFPNGGAETAPGVFKRLPYKMGFFDAFLDYAQNLRRDKPVVVCGDFNIAHRPVDLARPGDNGNSTGFLPRERAWMDGFVRAGWVDTFRHVHGDVEGAYSWWSYKTAARKRNVGWRLDYFFVSAELLPHVRDAWIDSDVYGSDHCPVGLALEF
jgi:exodeoxyribonuclease-3